MKDKSRIYTIIASGAAFIQMSLPQWHLPDVTAQVVSAALLAIVSAFTILKQRVSVEVNNQSVIYTWILVGIAALGGLNEIIGLVHINLQLQSILRSAIAAVIGLLNLASKSLFPTEAGQAIQGIKQGIKEGTVEVVPPQTSKQISKQ